MPVLPGEAGLAGGMGVEEVATGVAHLPFLSGLVELDRGGPPQGEPPDRAEFDGLGVETVTLAIGGEGQDVGRHEPRRWTCAVVPR